MKILAILQNAWFQNPTRMAWIRDTHFKGRRHEFVSTYLFFRCATGKKLEKALGEDLCGRIVWENASPEIASESSGSFPADPAHLVAILVEHKPDVVVTFGKNAADGMNLVMQRLDCPPQTFRVLNGPHPAARFGNVPEQLRRIGEQLRQIECEAADAAGQS